MESCLLGISIKKSEIQNYDRIYLGEEACDTFFLNKRNLILKSADLLYEKRKSFTIILPIVNEINFQRIIDFVMSLKERFTDFGEVICNDIGTMNVLSNYGVKIGAGRIFCNSHMALLNHPIQTGSKQLPPIERIEIDSSNLKYLGELSFTNISLITSNVIYGFSNDRCPYHAKYGQGASKSECKSFCKDKILLLENKYENKLFEFYHNVIKSDTNIKEIPPKINRVIKIETSRAE